MCDVDLFMNVSINMNENYTNKYMYLINPL